MYCLVDWPHEAITQAQSSEPKRTTLQPTQLPQSIATNTHSPLHTHTHIEIVPRLPLFPPRAHTLLSICDNGSFISKYQRLYLRPLVPRPRCPAPCCRIVCSLANIFVWRSNWHFQCGTKSVPSEVEMIQTVIKSASTWTLQRTLHWTFDGCERDNYRVLVRYICANKLRDSRNELNWTYAQ